MPELYIQPELIVRAVLPFAAAHIFALVLIYFTLVRQRLASAYPYFAIFIICFILFLCAPLVKVTMAVGISYWYEIIKNIALVLIGFPALLRGIYLLAKKQLSRQQHILIYGLSIVWACFYLIIRIKPFIVKNEMFRFLKSDYFSMDAAFYSQAIYLMLAVLLPSLYLFKQNTDRITRITLYGLFILCIALMIGCLFRHWEIMNAGCALTALIWGWSVFSDINHTNQKLAWHYKHEKALAKAQYASAGEASFSDYYPPEQSTTYPFKEREALINTVRTASLGLVANQVEELLTGLQLFTHNNPDIIRVRVREVLFMLVDATIYAGANAQDLTQRLEQKGKEISQCTALPTFHHLLIEECTYLCQLISEISEKNTDIVSVDNVKAFILANYFQDINIDDIASAVGLSRSHLMRTFKQAENQTINQYLIDVRIEKAKSLLLCKSVTEAALDVGFNNPNYFSTVFKKQVGQSPKEYQQQAKPKATV